MRESILRILQEEADVSGEELSRRLCISRTAVWKHIKVLRRLGYTIHSSPHNGYSFVSSPDLLLPDEIKCRLNTAFMGRSILYCTEATSTQDIAAQAAMRGDCEGTVIIAESQTRGRGRKNRHWISPAYSGIYLSAILRPRLRPDMTLQIPLIAGVAAARAIQTQTGLAPRLKWPNDIMLNGKKAGGILTEMSSDMDEVHYAILGIGLNVNTIADIMTGTLQRTATSLMHVCGRRISRVRLAQCLLVELENCYREFISHGFPPLRKEWLSFSQTIGSRVRVISGAETIDGKAIDIDEDGFLLIRESKGHIKRIVSGDVFHSAAGREN